MGLETGVTTTENSGPQNRRQNYCMIQKPQLTEVRIARTYVPSPTFAAALLGHNTQTGETT